MAILHFRILKNTQSIVLTKAVKAQNLIFKRAVITQHNNGQNPNLDGGIVIHCSFIQGFEIISNTDNDIKIDANDLIIPMDITKSQHDVRFDLQISNEDIRQAFTVDVKDFTNTNLISFDPVQVGAIKYIDLYFEYSILFDYQEFI
jgi:hypothetical protein